MLRLLAEDQREGVQFLSVSVLDRQWMWRLREAGAQSGVLFRSWLSGFWSQLCHSLPEWLWASCFSFVPQLLGWQSELTCFCTIRVLGTLHELIYKECPTCRKCCRKSESVCFLAHWAASGLRTALWCQPSRSTRTSASNCPGRGEAGSRNGEIETCVRTRSGNFL